MDQRHDHNGGGNADDKTCPMKMFFHAGHCERILWNGWVASTVTEFVLSALAIFVIAFIYELLKFLREHLIRKEANRLVINMAQELSRKAQENGCSRVACSNAQLSEFSLKNYWQRIFDTAHLIQSLLHLLLLIISYLLMLVIMTFNYWLCLAVLLGLGLGYFFFGWMKNDPQASECCQ